VVLVLANNCAGHLMPMDKPLVSLDLIDRFINGRTFADVPLPSEQSYLDAMVSGDDEIAEQAEPTLVSSFDSTLAGAVVLLFALLVGATYGWVKANR
jgi:hypothetical protein